jgi:hypothetical protein
MATTANDMSTDGKILRQLNDDYIHSDQNSDVARYEEFLAEDFTATLPHLVFRNRQEFLDLIAQREALYTCCQRCLRSPANNRSRP